MQGQPGKPQGMEELHGHQDDFGIGTRAGVPQDLHVELMELPEPPLLGPLMPEHGAYGVEL